MIPTRSTRLSQPQWPVEISPEFGGRGVVYLPNVQSGINRVAGTVGRGTTPQGISAEFTTAETKIERLTGSAPNGVTEFTQIVYLTPIAGGAVNDRGIFGNWNTTGATGLVQMVHRARDATTNGRYCYVVSYDPTSGATAAGIRTSDYSAVDNVPALLVATVKNNTLSLYLNGALHSSTAVAAVAMSGQAELQIGNYYDNAAGRRLSANVHMAAFLPRGLGGSEVAALSRNPWQLFRPVQRRVYFDMGAGGGGGTTHTVTADPIEQGSTTTRPGLTQTHVTTARAVAQGATVSRPAITQTHVVTARAVAQGSTVNAPAVEVGSITVVTARPVVQSSTVNAPSIVQTHVLTARPSAQGGTVTRPGLNQTHTVTARAVTQGSVVNAPSVDVGSTPATFVTARPVAQGSTVNTPGIRQTHVTSARAVVHGSTINAPGLVQTHVVTARPVVQASTVRVAGIAPPFVRSSYWASVPAERFKAAVPSEKFSSAVPGGNQ